MDAAGAAQLITAVTGILIALGSGFVWWMKRRDAQKVAKTEAAAVKTVVAWEQTIALKDEEISAWRDRFAMLTEDFERTQEIVRQQDIRLARKDERIAHLETLCDARGIQP